MTGEPFEIDDEYERCCYNADCHDPAVSIEGYCIVHKMRADALVVAAHARKKKRAVELVTDIVVFCLNLCVVYGFGSLAWQAGAYVAFGDPPNWDKTDYGILAFICGFIAIEYSLKLLYGRKKS